jgi:hypothetical protein
MLQAYITVDLGTCAGLPLTTVDAAPKEGSPGSGPCTCPESRARMSSATTFLLGLMFVLEITIVAD